MHMPTTDIHIHMNLPSKSCFIWNNTVVTVAMPLMLAIGMIRTYRCGSLLVCVLKSHQVTNDMVTSLTDRDTMLRPTRRDAPHISTHYLIAKSQSWVECLNAHERTSSRTRTYWCNRETCTSTLFMVSVWHIKISSDVLLAQWPRQAFFNEWITLIGLCINFGEGRSQSVHLQDSTRLMGTIQTRCLVRIKL